jgi:hypothetical protein
MIDPDQQKRFDQLCGAAFDDIATPEQLQELETMLQDDHWFEVYYHSVQIHATIAWELRHGRVSLDALQQALEQDGPPESAESFQPARSNSATSPARSMKLKPWYPYAAALLILGTLVALAAIMLASPSQRAHHAVRPNQLFASIVDVRDAVFENSDVATSPGSQVSGGFLRLASGQVDIEFFSGARVTVTGPASFGINSAMRGFLEHGHIAVFCPESAKGFTVGAPGVAIVDLGTRFSITKAKDGQATVAVQDGRVRVERGEAPAKELRRNDALVVDDQGQIVRESKAIAASEGRGFAGYVVWNGAKTFTGVLLIKKDPGSDRLSRIGLLRLDLASLAGATISQPELQMQIDYVNGIPRNIEVWALPDHHPEAQAPLSAAYWTSPASPWKADGSFNGSGLIHLGRISLPPRTAPGSSIRLSSEALTRLVTRHAGGMITLVFSADENSTIPLAMLSPMLTFQLTHQDLSK